MRHPLLSLALLAMLTACGGGGGNQASADPAASPAAVLQVQAMPSAIETATSTSSAVAAKAVDLTDAIAILKMIVGLDVNTGGAALTAYQAYAADVDANGKVELSDAISVLKRIVGLETASANWMFFNGTPTVTDKLNPGLPPSVSAAVSSTSNVSMTAVLRGDVVSSSAYTYSWALTVPAGSTAALASTTAANPSFKADVAGAYVATMTITDGSSNVATSSVTLTASTSGTTTTETNAAIPLAPSIVSASTGDTVSSVNFTAASTGATATSFKATCTPTNGTAVSIDGTASPISVTGLVNGTSYSCAVKAVNSAGSSPASTAMSVTPAAIAYATPGNFSTAITRSFSGSMVLASTVANRSRYMISDAASSSSDAKYLSMGSSYSASAGYAAESATLPTSTTYASYLPKLFQLVAQGTTGYHRIDSHLHPNNSLDFDANDGKKLKFRNNFGKASTLYGYLTFFYNPTTKLLQAKKRYTYSYTSASSGTGATIYTPSWTEDTSFSAAEHYVNHTNGVYTLVSTTAAATPLFLYNSPIDLGIPTFMNPKGVAFVDNGPAPFMSKVTTSQIEGPNGDINRSINSTYREQVATAGGDASTKSAADSMLATIKTAVEANGGKLRYAPAVYTAYRDAALATKLVSDSIADGTPGQNLVPYVYFTNEKDSNNVYHPFMVVVSYGNQASPNGLVDVPHPPALGSGSYPTSKVTRFSNLENYVQLIPMRDYGQVSVVTDNSSVISKNLWTGSSLAANAYTYADEADNGILIDGSVMFPAYNNTLVPSHLAGELSASGCHVGQGGGGPHCHSDGYQAGFGLALYNDSDYLNKTHPPLIGFGYDGIALFGKYREPTDATLLGYTTKLDDFGAHDHDGIGYHYHAHTVANHTPVGQSAGSTYPTTMYVLMKGAYIGKVTTVPYFRARSTFGTNKYMGGTVQ